MTELGLSKKRDRPKKTLLSNEVGKQHLLCARLLIIHIINLFKHLFNKKHQPTKQIFVIFIPKNTLECIPDAF